MKRILTLTVVALFLLAGASSALAKPPVLAGTTWTGNGSLIVAGQAVQDFTITFSIVNQTGALFDGTVSTDIAGFENPSVPFTGYIATDKRIAFTIQSPLLDHTEAVAVSSAKWNGKAIAGDIRVLPNTATGFFSVKKQK